MTERLIGRRLEDFAISPIQEMGAYEALWDNKNASFKNLAQMHQKHPNALPSDFVPLKKRQEYADHVRKRFAEAKISYGVRIHGDNEYPKRLRDAAYPVEFFTTRGGGILPHPAASLSWEPAIQHAKVSPVPAVLSVTSLRTTLLSFQVLPPVSTVPSTKPLLRRVDAP